MDTTRTLPGWLNALIADPEEHDSEWGRSCHFCGSRHGKYDQPLEHYIDCPWVIAMNELGRPLGDQHTIFEPTPSEPCEKCGWHYDSHEDWRGRDMPPPASEELRVVHNTHIAEEHGITYEQYLAGPPDSVGVWASDGPLAWHLRWGMYSLANSLPKFTILNYLGQIVYPAAPDLSDEAIREPGA